MKCKYCGESIALDSSEMEYIQLRDDDTHNYIDYDIEPDENISTARLRIEVNPMVFGGVGDPDCQEVLFTADMDEMCDKCHNILLNRLKNVVSDWEVEHESLKIISTLVGK